MPNRRDLADILKTTVKSPTKMSRGIDLTVTVSFMLTTELLRRNLQMPSENAYSQPVTLKNVLKFAVQIGRASCRERVYGLV